MMKNQAGPAQDPWPPKPSRSGPGPGPTKPNQKGPAQDPGPPSQTKRVRPRTLVLAWRGLVGVHQAICNSIGNSIDNSIGNCMKLLHA